MKSTKKAPKVRTFECTYVFEATKKPVPGRECAVIQVQAESLFRGHHLYVDRAYARHFLIHHFILGGRKIWPPDETPRPATELRKLGPPIVRFPTASTGQYLTLKVENTTPEPRRFRALLAGVGLKGGRA